MSACWSVFAKTDSVMVVLWGIASLHFMLLLWVEMLIPHMVWSGVWVYFADSLFLGCNNFITRCLYTWIQNVAVLGWHNCIGKVWSCANCFVILWWPQYRTWFAALERFFRSGIKAAVGSSGPRLHFESLGCGTSTCIGFSNQYDYIIGVSLLGEEQSEERFLCLWLTAIIVMI